MAQRRIRTSAAASRPAPHPAIIPSQQRVMRQPPAPPARSGQSGNMQTSTRHGTARETYYEQAQAEEVSTEPFGPGEEPAAVRFGAGMTINLQDYESLRLDCAVTLPCRPHEIEAAFERAVQLVADRLATEKENWLG